MQPLYSRGSLGWNSPAVQLRIAPPPPRGWRGHENGGMKRHEPPRSMQ